MDLGTIKARVSHSATPFYQLIYEPWQIQKEKENYKRSQMNPFHFLGWVIKKKKDEEQIPNNMILLMKDIEKLV